MKAIDLSDQKVNETVEKVNDQQKQIIQIGGGLQNLYEQVPKQINLLNDEIKQQLQLVNDKI